MNLTSNAEMMLATMSPDDIVKALPADIIPSGESATPMAASTKNSIKRAKRPVNGFMAFRSRYFKIFPSMTQKDASSLLTMLWAKDPWKHRWALIAKVYSFARDETAPKKLTLGHFLDVACPIMELPEADSYLETLGWSMFHDADGHLTGSQERERVIEGLTRQGLSSIPPPNTELELLSQCIANGFGGVDGPQLIAKMGCKGNILMAVDPEGCVRATSEQKNALQKKLALYEAIRNDPISVAANLMGVGRVNVSADIVYVDDFHQPIDLSLRQRHVATATDPNTSQVEHSYAMNEIVDNTLTHRYAYHMPEPQIDDSTLFDLCVTDGIPEYHDPFEGRLDNPIFLSDIIQENHRREEQHLELASSLAQDEAGWSEAA